MSVFNNKSVFLNEVLGKSDKQKILDYIHGTEIVEIGCGSGINLNMIEKAFPFTAITGVDISEDVVQSLRMKQEVEQHRWNAILGNAFELDKLFSLNSIDTIIFCSVLHEIYSYPNWQGKRFCFESLFKTLKQAIHLLKPKGRIIIRDGINSQTNDFRIIEFKDITGVRFLQQYIKDFQGRQIFFDYINNNRTVVMLENDAMEFLYTYTWGYEPYAHEVQEQYGYLNKQSYIKLLEQIGFNTIYIDSYVQSGYIKALKHKVQYMDQHGNEVPLPDSNCLIVAEKE